MRALGEVVAERGRLDPQGLAFAADGEELCWRDYDLRAARLAGSLRAAGLLPGERVAVLLPDAPGVHVAYLGIERTGCVTVGIGPRAGPDEVRHLLRKTAASALLSPARHRDLDLRELCAELQGEGLPLRQHLLCDGTLGDDDPVFAEARPTGTEPTPGGARALGPDDVWLLNSTSGTTGMPKCVVHDQRRWLHFHELALEAAALGPQDVFCSALPSPFGFGLWTAHVTPTLLGAPTVLMQRFDPDELVRLLEAHRVTVLAAVSTQFILMLGSAELGRRDLSSLRVLFTGGENVPYERAAEFEERTGARVLQFYGSNETGALSRTRLADSREQRLRSAGRIIPEMNVRLLDALGNDVTASGEGQPACRGPLTSRGYYEDEAANRELYTADGWMRTGDLASLDPEGYLRVVGRVADIIIRGGKNVSGPLVESHVATHPAVALAAAVAMPDPIFGERVCVYAELRPGASLDLSGLVSHLVARGLSKECLPERLEVRAELPRSSGGKVAKQQLRDDIAGRLNTESA